MRRKLLAGLVIGAALVLTVVVVLVRAGQGAVGWTGIVIKVPYCPFDADGCRVVAVPAGDAEVFTDPNAPHADWSGGATTLEIRLGAGNYSISAEGCTGYSIDPTAVSVAKGFHTTLDYDPGGFWNLPGILGRTCPGFVSTA